MTNNKQEKKKNLTDAILESISDGVFTVDENFIITSFNRAAEKITGINKAEAIGMICSDVFKSSMCEADCALRQTIKNKKPIINKTAFIVDVYGNKIPVSVSTAVLRDENNNIIGGAETFRDLSEIEALRKELSGKCKIGDFLSNSQSMCGVLELAKAVADSPSSVLIEGETGTGKEVLARAIHEQSPRKNAPFIAINCGALPDNLLESELFGYKKGAFTGAQKDKLGRFALADKGTIFLDEIGEISPAMQVKLLRVLQEKTFEPLGAIKSEKTDVRIIAATNKNLKEMVDKQEFRQDFFYRINVVSLKIPPLRERKDDIPVLADSFVKKLNHIQNRNIKGITPQAYSALMTHDWPGNVRELENIIERAFVLCRNELISIKHLPFSQDNFSNENLSVSNIKKATQENEKKVILTTLEKNNYNRTKTAKELGIHKTTFYRKIQKLGLKINKN